jgi:hypothetical protein
MALTWGVRGLTLLNIAQRLHALALDLALEIPCAGAELITHDPH